MNISVDDFGMTIFGLGEPSSDRYEIVPEQNTALEGLYKSSAMYCLSAKQRDSEKSLITRTDQMCCPDSQPP